MDLLVVLGSVTPPGRTHLAMREGLDRLGADVQAEMIDLADLTIGPAGIPPADDDDTERTVGQIAAAASVVFVSPTYRGSMTGVLKNLLDHVPVEALQDKATGIVASGATPHHFLGVDRHLRDVFTFYGALVTPVSVYLTSSDFVDGRPTEAAAEDVDVLLAAVLGLARLTDGRTLGGARPLPRRPKG